MSARASRRLVEWVARRPRAVLAAVVVVAVAAAAFAALTLRPSSGVDELVGEGSDTAEATQRARERFGDDAIYVLVRGDLAKTVLTADLQKVLGLEGCLSGNAPRGAQVPGGADGPCGRLAATKPVQAVYGPGTFVNESVNQIGAGLNRRRQQSERQAATAGRAAYALARQRGFSASRAREYGRQARELVEARFVNEVLQLALRYDITSEPRIDDANFVDRLVFDATKPPGTPKPRFAYLFPSENAALVQVRLKAGLGDERREAALALVREAVGMPQWRLDGGQRYVVTGAPVLAADLADRLTRSLVVLLVAALLVMAAVLAVAFRTRARLLPLGVALLAAALTAGALALAGAPLTMATVGVVPVLIGLAVDYAIQLQARLREAEHEEDGDGDAPLARAAARGVPTIVTAAAATVAGFLALALSPVPMVRDFGLLLAVGIVLALACALTAGTAVLVLVRRRPPRPVRGGPLAAALRGADELVVGNRVARGLRGAGVRAARGTLAVALRRPRRVLLVAVLAAVCGWAVDTQVGVESDLQRLVPQDLAALRDLETLQDETGVAGQVDVTVSGTDVTSPAVVRWMTGFQERVRERTGRDAGRACGTATLCPAFSLTDLLGTQAERPTRAGVRALLDTVPEYFSRAVITPDRRTATLAFGIRLVPLAEQARVIREVRAELDPPPGVRAELTGLPVLTAEAHDAVSSPWRRFGALLAGLLAVAVVLLVALRSPRRALVPLVPIVLATGWSALVLFALRIELNPMSVTMGALVIALSTEFSVLLSERFRQERAAGHDVGPALGRTYRSTGAAVVASGVTAVAGFAVLVVSDVQMLRDFGWVTLVDLSVSLVGVLVVLPAVLVLAEGARRPARAGLRRPRPLRRAGVT